MGPWCNAQRLDFRPQDYWKGGSTVTLKLALDGVEGADGVVGVQQKTVTFKIGRNQVSTVDAKTKQMTVTRDGKTIKTIPISAGSPDNPTYNGQMVISEKNKETRMNGATVGFTDDDGKGEYDIKDVPHAMRLSTSGTFIHGNYWGKGIFGSANTSHGCVGLADVKGGQRPQRPGRLVRRQLAHRRRGHRQELPGQDHHPGQRPQRLEHELGPVDGGLPGLIHPPFSSPRHPRPRGGGPRNAPGAAAFGVSRGRCGDVRPGVMTSGVIEALRALRQHRRRQEEHPAPRRRTGP
ncbi:hypothetical protein SCALM49S_08203 [Streptomyces californicus]